jgi:NADPH2:quinone reductase
VRACAINYPDVLIIEDKYQIQAAAAVRAGRRDRRRGRGGRRGRRGLEVGDRLIAVPAFGGLAEKIVIPAKSGDPAAGRAQLRRRRGAAADLRDLDPRAATTAAG